MRPALLRLLKRPAAISLLNDLFLTTSAPAIERLSASSGLCERCQIRQAHARLHPNPLSASLPVADSTLKLQVYDIDCDIRPTQARQQRTSRRSVEENLPLPLNVDQLEFESSLMTRTTNGKRRLVDDSAHQNDFALWKELLRYRKRRYAQHGVLEIWRGLCARKNDIKLPVEGELADYLWGIFLEAGLADEQLLFDIVKYAEELWNTSGKRWDKFYQKVVGGLFSQGLPEQAVAWHRRLQSIHLGNPNNIQLVMDQALSCVPRTFPDWSLYSTETIALGNGRGLRAFGEICLATKDHRIYETLVPFLLRKGLYLDATYIHDFLVKRGDIPHGSTTVQQLVDFTTSESHTFSQKVRQRIKKIKSDTLNPSFLESLLPVKQDAQLNSSGQEKDLETKPSQNGGQDWIQEKTFKDEFGARLFATKALTVDTITNGLQMFGVQAIGPLSLREIALRAGGAKGILENMRALREANITIRDCAFTRLVEKLALEHKDIVLEDLLHSDQHPDVMEDVAVQESLLCSYLLARDWRLYNLTKAILNEVAKDDMDNIQFRVSLSSKEWPAASDIADRVFLDGGTLTQQSINHMFYAVLTPRLPGRHEPYVEDPQFDEVSYAMRILKAAHRSGTDIDPRYWIELLKRMGMHRHDHWQQIHDLCSWLALNYALREESPFIHSLSRSLQVDSHKILARNRTAIRHIFNPRMQMALVAWGFKSNLWYKNQICEISDPVGRGKVISWTRGLILIRELETLGVTIYPSFVRKACRERLRILFGELYSVKRWNRTLREKNTIDLSRIVTDMTAIYPTLFNQEERANLQKIIDRPLPSMATKRMHEQYEWLDQWPASRLR